jgi:hypothetical protein
LETSTESTEQEDEYEDLEETSQVEIDDTKESPTRTTTTSTTTTLATSTTFIRKIDAIRKDSLTNLNRREDASASLVQNTTNYEYINSSIETFELKTTTTSDSIDKEAEVKKSSIFQTNLLDLLFNKKEETEKINDCSRNDSSSPQKTQEKEDSSVSKKLNNNNKLSIQLLINFSN